MLTEVMDSDANFLSSCISKYLKNKECVPKLKYEKSIIKETLEKANADAIFSEIFKKNLLNNRPVSLWKFWLLLHKMLNCGNSKFLSSVHSISGKLRALIDTYKTAGDDVYSSLDVEYGLVLLKKVEFHIENPEYDVSFSTGCIESFKNYANNARLLESKILRLYQYQQAVFTLQSTVCKHPNNQLVMYSMLTIVPEIYSAFLLGFQMVRKATAGFDDNALKSLHQKYMAEYPKIRAIFNFCEKSTYAPLSTINVSKLSDAFAGLVNTLPRRQNSASDILSIPASNSILPVSYKSPQTERHMFSKPANLDVNRMPSLSYNNTNSIFSKSCGSKFDAPLNNNNQPSPTTFVVQKSAEIFDNNSNSQLLSASTSEQMSSTISKSAFKDGEIDSKLLKLEGQCQKLLSDSALMLESIGELKKGMHNLDIQMAQTQSHQNEFFKNQVKLCYSQLQSKFKFLTATLPVRSNVSKCFSDFSSSLTTLEFKTQGLTFYLVFNNPHAAIAVREYSEALSSMIEHILAHQELENQEAKNQLEKIFSETCEFFNWLLECQEPLDMQDHAKFYDFETNVMNHITAITEVASHGFKLSNLSSC